MLLGLYAIVFTYLSLSQLTHERRLREVERLLVIGLLDAESGQRAYLLTGDRQFLLQYQAGLKALNLYEPVYASALLSKDGKFLFGNVSELLEWKKAEMQLTITTYDQVGRLQAMQIVRNRRGHTYTGQIYELLRDIQLAEARKAAPFELWRTPRELDIHDPDRYMSPSALLMKLDDR